MFTFYMCVLHIVHVVKCVWSNSQGPVCGAVKWSSNKNDSQKIFDPGRNCDYSASRSDHPSRKNVTTPLSQANAGRGPALSVMSNLGLGGGYTL